MSHAAYVCRTKHNKGSLRFWRLVFFTVCYFLFYVQRASAAEPFELHLLDVGQGQSVFVEADGHTMLIDGGGRNSSAFVVSYLREQGVSTLDTIVVSHYDEDHMAGLIGVLSVFPTDILLLPDYAGEGDLFQSFAAAAMANGCAVMHAEAGWDFDLGGASVRIIGPVRNDYENENDRSLVLRITYGSVSALIPGDAEQQSELDIAANISNGAPISSQIYVAGHHGSVTSNTNPFLDLISPVYGLISCGEDNGYGHPAMETLQRFQNHNMLMFRTDKQGTIVASSNGDEIRFNTAPCEDWTAGNGVIGLDTQKIDETPGGTRISPGPDDSEDLERETSYLYVCNTNTKKFHYPDCNSVTQMKEKNRLDTNLSREDLIAQGYSPCGSCKP